MRYISTLLHYWRYRTAALRTMLSAAALLLSQTVAMANGDSGFQQIAYVHVEGAYFVTVTSVAAFSNPDGCGNSTMVMLQSSAGGYSSIFASVLAAQAAGKAIEFWLTGCAATPWGYTVPVVYSVSVGS